MALSPIARHRARYLVPLGAAVITAGIVVIPQAASGATHPDLPARTAAQLLASLEQSTLPQFSGTVVETARLGLPDISDSPLASAATPADSSGLMQVVTLLTGSHTAQLAYGGPDKQRVAIFLSDLSEMDIVHNGSDVWTYSSDSNSVTHNTVEHEKSSPMPAVTDAVNPDKAAEQAIKKIDPSTAVTVDRTAEVADRPAYQLDLTPRDANTTVGSVRIALDSATSMPLRVQIWSKGNTSSPAFEVGFTSISMSPPNPSTFDFTTPPSATTEPLPFTHMFDAPLGSAPAGTKRIAHYTAGGRETLGHDWSSVFLDQLSDTPVSSTPTQVRVDTNGVKTVIPGSAPSFGQELDQLGTAVAGGHLITTTLVNILVTDDNRILVGAVSPGYLEQLAAGKAAQ